MTPAVRVDQVVGYLAARGWEVTGHWRGADVRSLGDFDVLVPPGDDRGDVSPRLRELLACVADAEGRTPREVVRDMVAPSADVLSYRLRLPRAGTVPLAAGFRAVRAVRDLVATCAHDVAPDTGDLLDRTALATAEDGFGLDVLVPVRHDGVGRRATLRVLRTSATVLAAADSPDPTAWRDLPRHGLVDDVCGCLADLAGEHRASAFELAFHWALALPSAEPDAVLSFPADFGVRARARRKRVEPVTAERALVRGRVTRLAQDSGGRRVVTVRGTLVVDGAPVGRERAVRVRVDDHETYLLAIEAHRAEDEVQAEGAVESTGTRYGIAVEPSGFTVAERGERDRNG
ncbi:hypothetical protein [Umezawaea tangerina]|uniref:Uncharacterized protein n=1 Tax=Umezawaea tangerina TaxID=84725 RepID=A0A2T0TG37_9PSEU|nr:hypothetical protein [Umezawaea tangerina]PRY44646.1 hypothetical protein CLV43_102211 [Umezawaea tangerina]